MLSKHLILWRSEQLQASCGRGAGTLVGILGKLCVGSGLGISSAYAGRAEYLDGHLGEGS